MPGEWPVRTTASSRRDGGDCDGQSPHAPVVPARSGQERADVSGAPTVKRPNQESPGRGNPKIRQQPRPLPARIPPSGSEVRLSQQMAAALIVATAFLVYIPALRNGFIWDDPLVLQQLRAIHGLGDLVVMPPQIPRYYYRPLIFVSYLIDRSLGGELPFWFHLSVIALHALNCLLVFR